MIYMIDIKSLINNNDRLVCVNDWYGIGSGIDWKYRFMLDDEVIIEVMCGDELVGGCVVDVEVCEDGGKKVLSDLEGVNVE